MAGQLGFDWFWLHGRRRVFEASWAGPSWPYGLCVTPTLGFRLFCCCCFFCFGGVTFGALSKAFNGPMQILMGILIWFFALIWLIWNFSQEPWSPWNNSRSLRAVRKASTSSRGADICNKISRGKLWAVRGFGFKNCGFFEIGREASILRGIKAPRLGSLLRLVEQRIFYRMSPTTESKKKRMSRSLPQFGQAFVRRVTFPRYWELPPRICPSRAWETKRCHSTDIGPWAAFAIEIRKNHEKPYFIMVLRPRQLDKLAPKNERARRISCSRCR